MPPLTKAQTSVYRLLDAEGHLLYVGITARGLNRLEAHARGKGWWDEVASVQVNHCRTRKQAMILERLAVETEHPLHNLYLQPKSPEPPKERVAPLPASPKPKVPRPILAQTKPRPSLEASEAGRLLRAMHRPKPTTCCICGKPLGRIKSQTYCSADCKTEACRRRESALAAPEIPS